MFRWLDRLRHPDDWWLGERLNWYQQNRGSVDRFFSFVQHLRDLKQRLNKARVTSPVMADVLGSPRSRLQHQRWESVKQ